MKSPVYFKKPDFCYWIGLVQADGSFKPKNTGHVIDIQSKDIEHIKFAQQISLKFLNRKSKIFKIKRSDGRIINEFRIGASGLIKLFEMLQIDFSDPPKPPSWVAEDILFFGAYLAGIIDGDGDIRVKDNPKNCLVRISSSAEQTKLKENIKTIFGCGCNIVKRNKKSTLNGRDIKGVWYELEFGLTNKNVKQIECYILPFIQIPRKRIRLENFIKTKLL